MISRERAQAIVDLRAAGEEEFRPLERYLTLRATCSLIATAVVEHRAMAEVLKVKARDELVRLTERELERKFGDLNPKQQSIAATKFYIREIHNPVATVIDDDDIDSRSC